MCSFLPSLLTLIVPGPCSVPSLMFEATPQLPDLAPEPTKDWGNLRSCQDYAEVLAPSQAGNPSRLLKMTSQ